MDNGVQTHILTRKSTRDEEYDMGMKYCPGTEPILPVYTHVTYKPSTSAGKFTIYTHSTSATGGEDGREEEAVGGEEESHIQYEMGRERSVREKDTFQKIDMTSLTELRQKFTEHGEMSFKSGTSAKLDVKLPTELSTSTLGRGAVRKLFPIFTHSMVGREGTLLPRPSANKKRKWDMESWDTNPKRHCGL